jgi:hypothetical protein
VEIATAEYPQEELTLGFSERGQIAHVLGSSSSPGLGCFASTCFVATTAITNLAFGQLAMARDAVENGSAERFGSWFAPR